MSLREQSPRQQPPTCAATECGPGLTTVTLEGMMRRTTKTKTNYYYCQWVTHGCSALERGPLQGPWDGSTLMVLLETSLRLAAAMMKMRLSTEELGGEEDSCEISFSSSDVAVPLESWSSIPDRQRSG